MGVDTCRVRQRRGGKAPARTQPRKTVYFPVHGVFGWDGALIAFAYQWARETGVGTELDL
jgi:hypothetical protein